MKNTILFATASMLMTAAPAHAQSAQQLLTGVTRAEALAGSVGRLAPRTRMRVVTDNATTEGSFSGTTGGAMFLTSSAGDTTAISLGDVKGMWKETRSIRRGAAIGAGFGGMILGSFGLLVVGGLCESSSGCHGDYVPAFLFAGSVGAAGGGILGAGLGALVKHWVRVDR